MSLVSVGRPVALVVLVLAGACRPDAGTAPVVDAGMALEVRVDPQLAEEIDGGTIHLEGPTPRTVAIAPGETRTIEGLEPGDYTVALEAFSGDRVVAYGETEVTVVAGRYPDADISLTSFTPVELEVPETSIEGDPIPITYGAVEWASGYVVEWAVNAGFPNPRIQDVEGTTAEITLDTVGSYWVRVRARDRFGSTGLATAAARISVVPRVIDLEDGVPLGDRAGAAGSSTFYHFDVPKGSPARVLQVRLRGGTGNADLALRLGSDPTAVAFGCASDAPAGAYGNGLDFCSVIDPGAGTWHILVQGTEAYSGAVLDARILPVRELTGEPAQGGLSAGAGDILYYRYEVPAPSGAAASLAAPASLHLATGGGSGDVDLLATPGTPAFGLSGVGAWTCVGSRAGNAERCDVDDPEAGPWTVILVGQAAFSGATLEARYTPPSRRLTVSAQGSGRIVGGGIDCSFTGGSPSGTCSVDVAIGTEITLTAEPAIGLEFTGWGGACTGAGTCTVTLSEDLTVGAVFAVPSSYRLDVSVTGSGRVTGGGIDCTGILGSDLGTCSVDVAPGTKVKLTASPSLGFRFDGWSGACEGSGACQVDMTQDHAVEARFSLPLGTQAPAAADGPSGGDGGGGVSAPRAPRR